MQFRDNRTESRFELSLKDGVAIADYQLDSDELIISRVFVPESLRGQGVAAKLMAAVVSETEKRGLFIVPVCSYAVSYMQRKSKG